MLYSAFLLFQGWIILEILPKSMDLSIIFGPTVTGEIPAGCVEPLPGNILILVPKNGSPVHVPTSHIILLSKKKQMVALKYMKPKQMCFYMLTKQNNFLFGTCG